MREPTDAEVAAWEDQQPAADQPTTEPSEALRLGRTAWDARAAIISYQSDDPDVVNETLEEIQTDIGRAILEALAPAPQPAADTEDASIVDTLREALALASSAAAVPLTQATPAALALDVLATEVKRLSGLVRDFNAAAGTLATERDDQTDRADRLDAVVTAVREAVDQHAGSEPGAEAFEEFYGTVVRALDGVDRQN